MQGPASRGIIGVLLAYLFQIDEFLGNYLWIPARIVIGMAIIIVGTRLGIITNQNERILDLNEKIKFSIFLNFFELPRSASLVGGLTLGLMTLPTIVIASRSAIKSVPPSIEEASIGLGSSKIQTIFNFTLPLAMPGILTGTIIGIARAIGETAPLLMIGMVAFIVDIPQGPLDASTALPVQIFLWQDSPERAFVERTSAAIIVLLIFLFLLNITAVYLRKKLEKKW